MAARVLQSPLSVIARNVHIYNGDGRVLGGLWQNGSITNANFYDMLYIILRLNDGFSVFRLNSDGSTGARLFQNRVALSPGLYIILSERGDSIPVDLTDEQCQRRVQTTGPSSKLTTRSRWFRERVRNRDTLCVISGVRNPGHPLGEFDAFQAAHIFPYSQEQTWVDHGLSRWISDTSPAEQQGTTKIHSVQNGLFLKVDVHALFDTYKVTVNPDDGYKIVCLREDVGNLDGCILHECCRNPQDPDRVSDELLRWHHHQAVLAHMRGAGQKSWEMDFPEGTDMMGEILQGEDAAERMEVELFTRLGAGEIQSEVSSPE